jgi:hypothetical protein
MQPHSLGTISISTNKTPAQRQAEGGWAARHGYIPGKGNAWAKGTVLPETQVQACPKVKVADLPEGHLKPNHISALEQNQKIASCCRHPENHEVEALKSHPDEQAPDVYVFHCTCGKKHRFFCVGMTDSRPVWDA